MQYTDKQTDRQTDRQADRQTDGLTGHTPWTALGGRVVFVEECFAVIGGEGSGKWRMGSPGTVRQPGGSSTRDKS